MLLRTVLTALTYCYHVQLRMPHVCCLKRAACESHLHVPRHACSSTLLARRGVPMHACQAPRCMRDGFHSWAWFRRQGTWFKGYVIPTRVPLQVCVHRCARPLVPCTSCHLYVLASSDRLCQRVRRGRTHRVAAAPHKARTSNTARFV